MKEDRVISFFDKFFNPRAIAIVGISRKENSLGQMILDNIIDYKYKGEIFLVHPKADEIKEYKCYKSLLDIDHLIDLMIVIIPAPSVKSLIMDAISQEIPAAIIITAGFREVSEAGLQLEKEISKIANNGGMKLIGPNSMGLFNATGMQLHASFSPIRAHSGNIGFLSQSGSILVLYQEYVEKYQLGYSKYLSLGNKVDINLNDSLQFLSQDKETAVINCYLESFSVPENFRKIAEKVSKIKPIIMVKGGKTQAGARAASSHTGALAGEDRIIHTILKSSGIIRVDDMQEMINVTSIIQHFPHINGDGIVIISSAGGPGIIAADDLIDSGLSLASFSNTTKNKLKQIVPPEGSILNPIDLIASADQYKYSETVNILLDDDQVDVILILIVRPVLIETKDILDELNKINLTKPLIVCYLAPEFYNHYSNDLHFPILESSKATANALKKVLDYNQWKNQYQSPPPQTVSINYASSRSIIETPVTNNQTKLRFNQSQQLLENYGFSFPVFKVVSSVEDAEIFAAEISYPVVMKISHSKIEHKTDVGGVRLNIKDSEELRVIWDEFMDIYDNLQILQDRKVQIQKFYEDGIEIALGIVKDPMFGHAIMVGSGGIFLELYDDVAFGIHPLAEYDINKMIEEIKVKQLLDGYRGSKPIDLNRLKGAIRALDHLIFDCPEIKELDINPILAIPETNEFVILDIIITLST